MRRHGNWNEFLAKELKHPEVAKGFILEGQDGGESLCEAIADFVRRYGVKEFVRDFKIPRATVFRFLADPEEYWDVVRVVAEKLRLRIVAVDAGRKAA